MLKKVLSSELRVGMYLHALEGSWTEHPFWRTRFAIREEAVIQQILDAGIEQIWIDVSKGLDLIAPATAPEPPQAPPPAAPAIIASPQPVVTARTPLAEEVSRAAKLCQRSRKAVLNMFNEARLGKAVDAGQCVPLVEEINDSVARNPSALISLARLKTHDDYSYMHSVAVSALMIGLARQLGLDEAQTREAGMAGLLHDLGKASMPLEVLNKPGKLTDAEFQLMRAHPARGYELLREVGSASESVMDVVLHHHERMDGKGYPHGLAGEQITTLARMGAICDVYDAVTSNRPYKEAWDPSEAVARMATWVNVHLDASMFQHFVKALGIYPVGSLVRLQSGRLAVVVEQNAKVLTAPLVRVFFSTKANQHITPELVDLASARCSDRITGRESNKTWGFQKLEQLWAGAEALRAAGK